jgi:hypothetical protein
VLRRALLSTAVLVVLLWVTWASAFVAIKIALPHA